MPITNVQIGGKVFNTPSTTIAYGANVTIGNTLIVKVATYDTGGAPAQPAITKSSGTATIGAGTFDVDLTPVFDVNSRLSIFRIPVTATGSLTLGIDTTNGDFNNCSIEEITAAGVITTDGSTALNTGTGVTESTSSVVTSGPAYISSISSEASTGDFTYTLSDVEVFKDSTGSTNATCASQYKIVSGSGSYVITADTANSWAWGAIAQAYKELVVSSPVTWQVGTRQLPGKSGPFDALGFLIAPIYNYVPAVITTNVFKPFWARNSNKLLDSDHER